HEPVPAPLSTLSLHDALPILSLSSQITPGIASSNRATSAISTGRNTDSTSLLNERADSSPPSPCSRLENIGTKAAENAPSANSRDRKSTRLNSSHVKISYAVF